jgi:Zn finger protein HypA/HybF involved in hydrogenase expression
LGSIRNVACPCGFKSPVTVGGSMRHFREDSKFPFYCETCGLVDVNVAKDDLYCPKCESRDIKQYGKPPISEPPLINLGYVSAGNYKADAKGHLCPACKKKTMEFTNSEMCFD